MSVTKWFQLGRGAYCIHCDRLPDSRRFKLLIKIKIEEVLEGLLALTLLLVLGLRSRYLWSDILVILEEEPHPALESLESAVRHKVSTRSTFLHFHWRKRQFVGIINPLDLQEQITCADNHSLR